MTRGRRIAFSLLILVGAVLLLAGGRWYVARERVADVARGVHARRAPAAVADPVVRKLPVVPGSTRTEPEAAARAAMHQHAVEHYQARTEADLKALPPAYQPLNGERFARLKSLADHGNARAACILAAQISKCSFFPGVARRQAERSARQIDEHRSAGREPPAALVASYERMAAGQKQLSAECDGVSFSQEHAAWRYQLQAALLGHPHSMATFSAFPAIDPASPGVSMDAIAAFLEYSGPFIETLAQRGDLNAATQASWGYGGYGPSVMREIGVRELPHDPARSLMYSYVRADIMRRWELAAPGSSVPWGKPESGIDDVLPRLSEREREWARQMADQMLASFDTKTFQPPADDPQKTRPDNMWDFAESACRD